MVEKLLPISVRSTETSHSAVLALRACKHRGHGTFLSRTYGNKQTHYRNKKGQEIKQMYRRIIHCQVWRHRPVEQKQKNWCTHHRKPLRRRGRSCGEKEWCCRAPPSQEQAWHGPRHQRFPRMSTKRSYVTLLKSESTCLQEAKGTELCGLTAPDAGAKIKKCIAAVSSHGKCDTAVLMSE